MINSSFHTTNLHIPRRRQGPLLGRRLLVQRLLQAPTQKGQRRLRVLTSARKNAMGFPCFFLVCFSSCTTGLPNRTLVLICLKICSMDSSTYHQECLLQIVNLQRMAAFPTSPDILSKWYLFHLRVKLFLLSLFHVARYSQLFHGFVTLADYNLFQARVVHGFSTALV